MEHPLTEHAPLRLGFPALPGPYPVYRSKNFQSTSISFPAYLDPNTLVQVEAVNTPLLESSTHSFRLSTRAL